MTSVSPTPAAAFRSTLIGLVVNVLLAAAKLVAGVVGHSYALIADAVESLTDIFGSVVILGGLQISAKPADEGHPYGHGKAEALAGLFVSLLVCLAGLGVATQAVREILNPGDRPEPFTLVVLIAVVVIKETLFRIARRAAKASASTAADVDAWHHRADAITSVAAFIGISVSLVAGPAWRTADAWAALFASAIIVYNSWRLARTPLEELMDAAPDDIIKGVYDTTLACPGVMDVHKVAARKSGTGYWIDMHVRVDPAMPVSEAHTLVHRVKDEIRRAMPRVKDVLIHVEPFDPKFATERASRSDLSGPGPRAGRGETRGV